MFAVPEPGALCDPELVMKLNRCCQCPLQNPVSVTVSVYLPVP